MKRVLIVEDHPEIRSLLAQLLQEAGYAVVDAWTFAEAKRRLDAERFDLLISDVLIPGGGQGTDLAEMARASSIKYLLVTGHPAQMQALDEQQQPYIAKPFRAAEFVARINRLCERD
jgi:DNA-binding response OmpR family regulator